MNLVDNGLHSFKKAINSLKEIDDLNGSERELVAKEIVLSLHHSIETLFKYIIQNKNELLIYEDLKDYFTVKINIIKDKGKKDFNGKTITFMEAVERTIVLNDLDVNITDLGSLEHLNNVRNAITHHEYDLGDKQINYLITQVITVVFPIYKSLIPNFTGYVRDHNLNLIGSTQVKEFNVWKFIRFFNLYSKFKEAKNRFELIIRTEGEFSKKQKAINKKSFITYHQCPCCNKDFFVKEGIVVDNTVEKGYKGKCLMCGISFDKEDSYFIYLLSKDYDSFFKNLYQESSIIKDLLDDEELSTKLTTEEIEDIKKIHANEENSNLLLQIVTNHLDNTVNSILEEYVGDIANSLETDVMDNALFTGTIEEFSEIEEMTTEERKTLKTLVDNIEVLQVSNEDCERICEQAFEREYVFYWSRPHPNPHQDNEEVDIEIELTLSLTDQSIYRE